MGQDAHEFMKSVLADFVCGGFGENKDFREKSPNL
jgi:hypothetical protein